MRRFRWWLVPALLVAVLVAGHTAAWFYATQYLKAGFDQWAAQRRAAGWDVTSGRPARGGWPTAAALTIPNLRLAAVRADARGQMMFQSERTVLRLTPWDPLLLNIDLGGTQTVQGAPGPAASFTADRIHLETPLRGTGPDTPGTLEIRNLRGEGVTVGLITGQVAPAAAPTLSLAAEAIRLPAGSDWPFGPRISSVSLDVTLDGGLPRPGTLAASAAAWHEAGGALRVTRFALGWGPLGLSATARLDLDDRLQPAGTADLKVIGYAAALKELSARRFISKDASRAATAVLALLARQPSDGGAPEVEVPLTLREGIVSMGQVPLVRVPPVVWPDR
jgi:hypothetical protein